MDNKSKKQRILILITLISFLVCVFNVASYADDVYFSNGDPNRLDYKLYVAPNRTMVLTPNIPLQGHANDYIEMQLTPDERSNGSNFRVRYNRTNVVVEDGEVVQELTTYNVDQDVVYEGKQSLNAGFYPWRRSGNDSYRTNWLSITNNSNMVAEFSLKSSKIEKYNIVITGNAYENYLDAHLDYITSPQFSISMHPANSYTHLYSGNRLMINGQNLRTGRYNIYIDKIINEFEKSRVSWSYQKELDFGEGMDDVSEEISLPQLEIGNYVLHGNYSYYEYDNMITLTAEIPIEITERSNAEIGELYSYVLGNKYINVDAYFNKIFQIQGFTSTYPYEDVREITVKGNKQYLRRAGILQHWHFNNKTFLNLNKLVMDLNDILPCAFRVYLNGSEIGFQNIESSGNDLTFSFSVPVSKLKNGQNTIIVTTSLGLPAKYGLFSNNIGGNWKYVFAGKTFNYKVKGEDIPPIGDPDHPIFPDPDDDGGGGGWVSPDIKLPKREDYPEGLGGSIAFGLNYFISLISAPFLVLAQGISYIVSMFTGLFSWVGTFTAMIGSWFNFLPAEIKALLLGLIVSSFVAFVLSLFRK